jgi:hypothetical protein
MSILLLGSGVDESVERVVQQGCLRGPSVTTGLCGSLARWLRGVGPPGLRL